MLNDQKTAWGSPTAPPLATTRCGSKQAERPPGRTPTACAPPPRRLVVPLSWNDRRNRVSRAPRRGLQPDRVPDGLHLKERGDPFGSLRRPLVEPVEAGVGHGAGTLGHPLHAVRRRDLGI